MKCSEVFSELLRIGSRRAKLITAQLSFSKVTRFFSGQFSIGSPVFGNYINYFHSQIITTNYLCL